MIDRKTARRIIAALPPFVHKVGVFVDAKSDDIIATIEECGLTAIQFHGRVTDIESGKIPVPVIMCYSVGPGFSYEQAKNCVAAAVLLDAYDPKARGGTGKTFDWDIAARLAQTRRVILAGGLDPENIVEAIETVHPYAVDVCSGIEESPGIKDKRRLRVFLERVKIHGI